MLTENNTPRRRASGYPVIPVKTGIQTGSPIEVGDDICNKNSIVLEIGASSIQRTVELATYCKKIIGVELMPDRIPPKKLFGKYYNSFIRACNEN